MTKLVLNNYSNQFQIQSTQIIGLGITQKMQSWICGTEVRPKNYVCKRRRRVFKLDRMFPSKVDGSGKSLSNIFDNFGMQRLRTPCLYSPVCLLKDG